MIPKKIHYCWFGGNPLPELAQRCIASWKKFCPDYEIVEWNEDNFDVSFCDFAKEAFAAKKWAFLSDCARLEIVYREGGIYLDTDVELLKSLDDFLCYPAFFGTEKDNGTDGGWINTGVGFGAEKGNGMVGEMLRVYKQQHFLKPDGSMDIKPCPEKNTEPFYSHGYHYSDTDIWSVPDATVFPPEYFNPYDFQTDKQTCTDNTVSIHHYAATWFSRLDRIVFEIEKCDMREHPAEYKMRRCISFPFRVANKVQKLGVWGTLRFAAGKIQRSNCR